MKNVSFSNGDKIPSIGLGTYKILGKKVYPALRTALELGYRHFDCAALYHNEKEIGKVLEDAIKAGEVRRDELFITSKLWGSSLHKEFVVSGLEQTLKELRLDYLDLYLVHWPIPLKPGVNLPKNKDDFFTPAQAPLTDSWKMFEACREKGLTRHIGVSNFNSDRIKEIQSAGLTTPEVNQVELHPFLPQEDLVRFCQESHILVEGYCPLGSPGNRPGAPSLLRDQVIEKIASKHQLSTAKVILSWAVQRDIIVLPKSSNRDRQKDNLESLELDQEDLRRIAGLASYRYEKGIFMTDNGSPYDASYLWEDQLV